MSVPALLIAAATASALATIAADWRTRRPAFYLFKPLTTMLIIGLGAVALPPVPGYRALVLLALGLCLVGDVFLMSRRKAAFVCGLVAFLFAHLALVVAFGLDRATGFSTAGIVSLVLMLVALVLAERQLRRVVQGGLRLPVMVYAAVLLLMVLVAGNKALSLGGSGPWLVFAGALLFAISDAVLAYRKFVRVPPWGQPLTLLTYYSAIGLFACAY